MIASRTIRNAAAVVLIAAASAVAAPAVANAWWLIPSPSLFCATGYVDLFAGNVIIVDPTVTAATPSNVNFAWVAENGSVGRSVMVPTAGELVATPAPPELGRRGILNGWYTTGAGTCAFATVILPLP
ncbi:hypothetical protein [Antrihabitans cavernicola]|uniref:Uncharacterized protein n=1 Tax=Antrihabitans cavernicola TaxID=2495913 RepID=A0A5A7SH56_9NOCA|nr:hypothetical protein [Spelaeibacter cavernicola]KAA0024047.1 hypothetical protein FOY51_05630 [Spelaeibacter cavernicola]